MDDEMQELVARLEALSCLVGIALAMKECSFLMVRLGVGRVSA